MDIEDLRRIFGGESEPKEEQKQRRWREKAEKRPGAWDTIRISRVDFWDAIGDFFGDEMSNGAGDGIVTERRLTGFRALLGSDSVKALNAFYGHMIEECIFGPQAGEPSRFRGDGKEIEEPAPRTELAAEALPMLAAAKIAEYCGNGEGELWPGKADYPHWFRAAMEESLRRDRALWDRIPDGTALSLMISVGCRIADELFRPYDADEDEDEETEGAE